MNNKIPGYFTGSEVMDFFKWKFRSQLSATAKTEGWKRYPVGRAFVYPADQIHEFDAHRTRTKLARELGIKFGTGLYRDDEWDFECPLCFCFAIERPPTQEEISSKAWQLGEYEAEWLCINGHGHSEGGEGE